MLIQVWQIAVGLVGSVLSGGAISAVLMYRSRNRKAKVDTDSIIVKNIMDWAVQLTQRIDKLEVALEEKERQIDELIKESHNKDILITDLSNRITKLQNNGGNNG